MAVIKPVVVLLTVPVVAITTEKEPLKVPEFVSVPIVTPGSTSRPRSPPDTEPELSIVVVVPTERLIPFRPAVIEPELVNVPRVAPLSYNTPTVPAVTEPLFVNCPTEPPDCQTPR